MKRKEILELIDETYNNIYAFTDRYNLSNEDSTLMEALCDDYDPTSLSKDTLSCLLDAYKEALADLRCE